MTSPAISGFLLQLLIYVTLVLIFACMVKEKAGKGCERF